MNFDEFSDANRETIQSIMDSHGFDELTGTQETAFKNNILNQKNHLLIAETGNGKTLCAEALSKKRLDNGKKVAYLVPSRQLVRDKRESINEWASEYTVSSGRSKYHNADIAVATFASFYKAVLKDIGNARNFDLVILDDFHEIYGSFIGPEIEKAIAAVLYEDIEIFAMSATIGNPQTIGDWLNADVTVSNENRQIEIEEYTSEYTGGSKKKAIVDFIKSHYNEAPFLVFNFAKSWTESRAQAVADEGLFKDLSNRNFRDELRGKIDGDLPPSLDKLSKMLNKGVAYHHSDLPQSVKQYIEDLYYEDEIGCLFATTTIAYGFDAPVQSVLVADIKRQSQWVGVWEYQQWIGRAARPGYGYEKGYAYTLTRDPEAVEERYFEPRELEPVQTHIEDNASFRKFVLELIGTGWDSPDKIENFTKETLYWNQLSTGGTWNQTKSVNALLSDKLQSTVRWLTRQNFIEEYPASRSFGATELGSGAVEFLFSTFGSYNLTQIRQFYEWAKNEQDIQPLNFTTAIARFFGPTVNSKNITQSFGEQLRKHELEPSDETVTSGVLNWYWTQNTPNAQIDEETGVDSAYLYSTASKIARVMDATTHLFAAIPDTPAPSWLDLYVTQVQRGIKNEEVPLVENTPGLGRYRVRNLRKYLKNSNIIAFQDIPQDTPLYERLSIFYDKAESKQKFVDVLRGNVKGIGPATAKSLYKFASEDNEFDSKDTINNEPEEEINSNKNSTLDEWT